MASDNATEFEVETTRKEPDSANNGLLEDFAQTTTLHGMHWISSSRSKTGKLIWSALLILSFYYMVTSNISSVRRYLRYPFTTELSEEFAGQNGLKFPAITVCPMNMFVKKKVELQDSSRWFHDMDLNLEICKQTRQARSRYNLTCGMFLMCTIDQFYSMGGNDCGPENQIILANYLDVNRNASATRYQEQFRDVYGPSLQHSLVECRFGDKKCHASEFTKKVTRYGKCFQFNGNSKNASWSYTNGLLLLVLDAKVNEYTKSPSFTEGFKVFIQDQGTYTSSHIGFVVSPGNIASVNVNQRRKNYLKTPFKSNCTDSSLLGYSTYTLQGCLLECFENMRILKCGCRSCGYLEDKADSIRICGSNDSYCERRIKKFQFNPKNCDCRPPCSEITYDYKLSYSVFPDRSSIEMINKHRKISVEYQRQNFVAIMINYDATSYSTQDEKETYTWESLLGEFGGNLGLMVGCSVLTGAEIIQLLIQLIYGGVQKLRCHKRVTLSTDST